MRYQDYLEASADELHLGPYTEVFDILNRYELLKQTRERTRQRLATLDAEIITHQEELETLHEQHSNKMMVQIKKIRINQTRTSPSNRHS